MRPDIQTNMDGAVRCSSLTLEREERVTRLLTCDPYSNTHSFHMRSLQILVNIATLVTMVAIVTLVTMVSLVTLVVLVTMITENSKLYLLKCLNVLVIA
jgi:hypothetical protein